MADVNIERQMFEATRLGDSCRRFVAYDALPADGTRTVGEVADSIQNIEITYEEFDEDEIYDPEDDWGGLTGIDALFEERDIDG